jgi:hypothetical protein
MVEAKGFTTGLVIGIIGLVILVIISLVVVSTISKANLVQSPALTQTNQNATIAGFGGICINTSGLTDPCGKLTLCDGRNRDFTIIRIDNESAVGMTITNYTFNPVTCRFVNTTKTSYTSTNVTFTYRATSDFEASSTGLAENLTDGMSNVAEKVPTILLIASVVLLLSVLIFLIAKSREITSASGLGSGKSAGSSLGEGSQL